MLAWLEWLAVPLWWYAAGAVFALIAVWLFLEIHRAPHWEEYMDEPTKDELKIRSPLYASYMEVEPTVLKIYLLSCQIGDLLADKQYAEALLLVRKLESASSRLLIERETQTAVKAQL